MALNIIQGYSPSTTEPIDSRFVTATSSSRFAIPIFNAYEGLLVYQQDNNKLYTLIDTSNITNNNGWQEIGSGSGGGVGGNGTPSYLPKWNTSTTLTDSNVTDNGTTVSITTNLGIGNNGSNTGTYLSVASILSCNTFVGGIPPNTSGSFITLDLWSNKSSTSIINYKILATGYDRAGTIQVYIPYDVNNTPSYIPFSEQSIESLPTGSFNSEDIYFDFIVDGTDIKGVLVNNSTSSVDLFTEYKTIK